MLSLFSEHVVTPEGVRAATVQAVGGRFTSVRPGWVAGAENLGRLWLLPGLVDTHVHCNDPGRSEWEGFETATAAAAAGGVTTIIDMPLNSIPATTSVSALEEKKLAAAERCRVDYGFWGGLVKGNAKQLPELAAAGVCGFKAFLVDPGLPEFAEIDEADLVESLPILTALGKPLLVHAELPEQVRPAPPSYRDYRTWLESRPESCEVEAIELLVRLCRRLGTRLHIVHVSAVDALAVIRRAQAEGLPITAETCPHYLYFAAERIADGATHFKCAPPIRDRVHQDALWGGLSDGTLSLVASDHSPSSPGGKCLESGDFGQAWGGIASLGLSLPVIWTEARKRGFTLPTLVRWLSEEPAKLAGLAGRKGKIAEGWDADLAVFDPTERWQVTEQNLHFKHKVSPYVGEAVAGRVRATYLRGELVYSQGEMVGGYRGCVVQC